MSKIKDKIHKLFFPSQDERIDQLKKENQHWLDKCQDKEEEIIILKQKNLEISVTLKKLKDTPTPSLADLMRENLGVARLNFADVDENNVVPHFLNTVDQVKRKTYVNQLANCWQQEAFQLLCKNFIDFHGNFAIRTSNTNNEDWAARMTINGVAEVRDAVKSAYDEYIEGSKPADEFDKFETTEGVPINKDNEE